MLKKRFASTKDLDGVIDLERLRSGSLNSIERDAEKFFSLTYPTEDVHAVLRTLCRRFGAGETGGEGLFLAQSVKGLGKSHTLLMGYHLFASPVDAKAWAKKLGYEWTPPADPIIIVHKFTDQSMPEDALWLTIAKPLGQNWSKSRPPDLDDFRAALGHSHLVLILDELERGINNILNPNRRNQNLSFLQLLSEEAARDRRITIFAAIYDGNIEPGATLKRPQRVELRFRKPEDRASIVRHRLFLDAETYDREAAKALIRSYTNTWKRFGIEAPDGYTTRMEATFPFLPDLIDLVFERIVQSGGFQGTRSALGLLGAMLDAGGEGSYLMTAAHCRLTDKACTDRLSDLDPAGTLINCATGNHRELSALPGAESIASSVLLASLVPGGHTLGLTREELIHHVAGPGSDPNQFQAGLDAFKKFGTYFHEREGRLFFDLEENEYAKVELDAVKHSNDEEARKQIIVLWQKEVFRETHQTIVFQDIDTTKTALQDLPKQGPRYVLAPRRLSLQERYGLYHGLDLRNQILLFEPKDSRIDHLNHPDLIAFAKRFIAATSLAVSPGSSERRSRFEQIAREQAQQIQKTLRSTGLIYIRIDHWGETPEQTQFEEETLGSASSKEEVLTYIRTQIYPPSLFHEHLRGHRRQWIGQRVDQVDRAYRNTLGYPVPLTVSMVTDAVRFLVSDRARILGLQHSRRNFCGEPVHLSEAELGQAVLSEPWSEMTGPPFRPAIHPSGTPIVEKPSELIGEAIGTIPVPASPISVGLEERGTPHCRGLGELRQTIATRLIEIENPIIQRAKFTVFANYKESDFTGLPSAYRGALSGKGDAEIQLDLTIKGPLTKAELEGECEKLPNLRDATYSARFWFEKPSDISRGKETNRPEEGDL